MISKFSLVVSAVEVGTFIAILPVDAQLVILIVAKLDLPFLSGDFVTTDAIHYWSAYTFLSINSLYIPMKKHLVI